MAMNPRMSVSGFTETVENLRTYSRQMQQNIERKAMRQTMNKQKAWQKVAWRNYPVQKSSLEWGKGKIKTYKSGRQKLVRSYSIRKETAKALTVKVGTTKRAAGLNKSAKFIVYGRLFLRTTKLNAKASKLAHFLEMDRKGFKGRRRIQRLYDNTWPRMFKIFAKALKAYVHMPKAKASTVREWLD
tara:strand:- start:501 stop:1058 length:558 start_codon:yes stop_codon:yes gene_type:complete